MNDIADVRAATSAIGAPVERVEDERLLRGQGEFVDDVKRPDMLHAAVLRSPLAHGRIRSIDVSAALAVPGVHAVITAADVVFELGAVPVIPQRQEALAELEAFYQPVVAHSKVRYAGEPVAVVVARDRALAEDALTRIQVDIEALPVVGDCAAAGITSPCCSRRLRAIARSRSRPARATPRRCSHQRRTPGASAFACIATWRRPWRRAACLPIGTRRPAGWSSTGPPRRRSATARFSRVNCG